MALVSLTFPEVADLLPVSGAREGVLVVPIAQTFSFADAPAAFATATSPHPSGKLALVNAG
jgi:hypothetical protein